MTDDPVTEKNEQSAPDAASANDARVRARRGSIWAILLILVVAAVVALMAGQGGAEYRGIPVFWICAIIAFVIQWIVYVPSYIAQTEHYFDAIGSVTYLTLTGVALWLTGSFDVRSLLIAVLVGVWATRLGTFLFLRTKRSGGDGRFDALKTDPIQFLMVWTLQGLWVLFTLSAGLAALSAPGPERLQLSDYIGVAIFVLGFGIEVIADRQKSHFRAQPENAGRFISTGLWSWSRHPNYFGEIVLWIGIFQLSWATLEGTRWVVALSPVFVAILLTRISGIPMLERRAEKRWGHEEEYQRYKASTAVLIPLPPRR